MTGPHIYTRAKSLGELCIPCDTVIPAPITLQCPNIGTSTPLMHSKTDAALQKRELDSSRTLSEGQGVESKTPTDMSQQNHTGVFNGNSSEITPLSRTGPTFLRKDLDFAQVSKGRWFPHILKGKLREYISDSGNNVSNKHYERSQSVVILKGTPNETESQIATPRLMSYDDSR